MAGFGQLDARRVRNKGGGIDSNESFRAQVRFSWHLRPSENLSPDGREDSLVLVLGHMQVCSQAAGIPGCFPLLGDTGPKLGSRDHQLWAVAVAVVRVGSCPDRSGRCAELLLPTTGPNAAAFCTRAVPYWLVPIRLVTSRKRLLWHSSQGSPPPPPLGHNLFRLSQAIPTGYHRW